MMETGQGLPSGKRVQPWMVGLMLALVLPSGMQVCGCEGSGSSQIPEGNLGDPCYGHGDCLTGRCLLPWDHLPGINRCTMPCETSSCAYGFICGISTDGSMLCVNDEYGNCIEGGREGIYACIGEPERPVACEQAREAGCITCGCPADDLCLPVEGNSNLCDKQATVGGSCWGDMWCLSGNCSKDGSWGVCNEPIGGACTAETCQHCVIGDGWSYCTRGCNRESDCPGGYACAWRYVDTDFYCWQYCYSEYSVCPGELTCSGVETSQGSGIIAFYACL